MQAGKLFIAVILQFQCLLCMGQIEHDVAEAFRVADETQKPILLVFAGSDWCAPCIRFDNQVLSQHEFLDFAKENFVILKADFPQRKKLPQAEQEQNELLAEQYNPKGIFPNFVLLRLDKSVASTFSYRNQTSKEFISEVKASLSK